MVLSGNPYGLGRAMESLRFSRKTVVVPININGSKDRKSGRGRTVPLFMCALPEIPPPSCLLIPGLPGHPTTPTSFYLDRPCPDLFRLPYLTLPKKKPLRLENQCPSRQLSPRPSASADPLTQLRPSPAQRGVSRTSCKPRKEKAITSFCSFCLLPPSRAQALPEPPPPPPKCLSTHQSLVVVGSGCAVSRSQVPSLSFAAFLSSPSHTLSLSLTRTHSSSFSLCLDIPSSLPLS